MYLLRGQRVTVLTQWAAPRPGPDEPVLPHVHTSRTAPRNVLIRYPDGTTTIRPSRGLRRPPIPDLTGA